jgi:hypothetical protein
MSTPAGPRRRAAPGSRRVRVASRGRSVRGGPYHVRAPCRHLPGWVAMVSIRPRRREFATAPAPYCKRPAVAPKPHGRARGWVRRLPASAPTCAAQTKAPPGMRRRPDPTTAAPSRQHGTSRAPRLSSPRPAGLRRNAAPSPPRRDRGQGLRRDRARRWSGCGRVAWREDHRRVDNGRQVQGVMGLAMAWRSSVAWRNRTWLSSFVRPSRENSDLDWDGPRAVRAVERNDRPRAVSQGAGPGENRPEPSGPASMERSRHA